MRTRTEVAATASRDTPAEWPSEIRGRSGSGKVELVQEGGSQGDGQNLWQFEIPDYDDPMTIRVRRYTAGAQVLLEDIGVEMEATLREGSSGPGIRPSSTVTGGA